MQNVNAAAPNPPMGMEPFGDRFNEVFRLWSAQWQVWVLQGLIYFAFLLIPFCIIMFAFGMGTFFSLPHNGAAPSPGAIMTLVGTEVIAVIICSLFACALLPGMVNTALKQIRGQPISVGDIFSRMHNVWGAWLVYLLTALGVLACYVGAFVMQGLLMLAVPLMVDQQMTTSQAISVSWNTTKSNFWLYVLFALVMAIIAGAGAIACYIGVIATLPLLSIGQAVAYTRTFPTGMMMTPGAIPGAIPPPYQPGPGLAPEARPEQEPGPDAEL